MTHVVSNCSLSGLRDNVRVAALSDFSYFATALMGCPVETDVAAELDEVINLRCSAHFFSKHPRRFAQILHAWLSAQGYAVLGCEPPTQQELLQWLDIATTDPQENAIVISLAVLPDGVSLQWL